MGGIEFNKIFAAILIAGITAMFAGFLAEKFVHAEKLEENAFKIEGVEVAGVAPKADLAEPILALLADADVARGQKISKACAACHSFDQGGANGVGPNMYQIVAKKKQSVPGFSYSGALNQNGEEIWTYEALNKFLWKPKNYAPGTKMNYIGLRKPEDRAAIIAWLRTLSPSLQPLPTEQQILAEQAELAPPEDEAAEELLDAVETLKEGDPGDVTSSLEDEELQEASEIIVDAVNEEQGENLEQRSNPTLD